MATALLGSAPAVASTAVAPEVAERPGLLERLTRRIEALFAPPGEAVQGELEPMEHVVEEVLMGDVAYPEPEPAPVLMGKVAWEPASEPSAGETTAPPAGE